MTASSWFVDEGNSGQVLKGLPVVVVTRMEQCDTGIMT